MPNMNRHQWPAPSNWEEFEDLCLDLWKRIWQDPYAEKNGRKGQAQNGVDVFGRPNRESDYEGVQCKGKDNYVHAMVTEEELDVEIKKAEGFKPKIKHFILATTAPQDAGIQEYARKLSEKRQKKNKFTVTVVSWEWIKANLGDHPDIASKHGYNIPLDSPDDPLKALNTANLQEGAFSPTASVQNGGHVTQNLTIIQNGNESAENLHAEVDYSKKLLNNHHAIEALHFLDEIEDRVSRSTEKSLKYRFYANKGAANLELEKQDVAAGFFLQALPYSDENKAVLNASLAHLIRDENDDAIKYADQVLDKDPNNTKAYSYKVQALYKKKKLSLDELVAIVPKRHHNSADIALAFGFVASLNEDEQGALAWYKVALENDKDDSPEIKAELAGKLLEPITNANAVAYLGQLTTQQREDLEVIVKLLSDAWALYAHTETRRYKTRFIYNRALAKRLLNDMEGAIKDNEEALLYEPNNTLYKKHLAHLYHENNERDKSLKILRELVVEDDMPEVKILLAERLSEDGKDYDEAILLLEDFLGKEKDLVLRHGAYYILLQLYLDTGRVEDASKLIKQYKKKEEDVLFGLMLSARFERSQENLEAATLELNEAYKLIDDSTPVEELSTLADELFGVGLFDEASKTYERFINPSVASIMSRRLLVSYYRAGKHDKALKLCTVIREQLGVSEYVTEMESSIYEDIGDLSSAEKVCTEFLKSNPNDNGIKLRLAVIYLRQGKEEKIDGVIDSITDLDTLQMNDMRQLAGLYMERGHEDRSREIMYEARRKFFDAPDVHLTYMGTLLGKTAGEDDPLLNIKSVDTDTVVFLEDDQGAVQTYIIEQRSDPRIKDGEINLENPITQQLLGKKVGDKVKIAPDSEWKITEIKSKYLHALHETMANYGTWFPGASGLQKITFAKGSEEEALKKILSTVDDKNEAVTKAMSLYSQGKLTIGALASTLGYTVIDTVYGVMEQPQVGLRAAIGTEEELLDATKLIDRKPILVADLTSIIVLYHTEAAEKIVSHFGKLLIPQSIVDELRQKLKEVKSRESSGYDTLGKKGKQYIRDEVTPERVAKNIKHLEELIAFIEQYCKITPVSGALKVEAKRRKEYADVLGANSVDAALLAKEDGNLLLSDDQRLRALAKNEFEVEGTWTQAVLIYLRDKQEISEEEYAKATLKLPSLHYRHTRVDANMLLAAAKEAKWSLQYPYVDMVKEISVNETTTQSLSIVVTEFLYRLWKQPLMYEQKFFLAQYLLTLLAKRGFYDASTLNILEARVNKRFALFPSAAQEIRELIAAIRSTLSS